MKDLPQFEASFDPSMTVHGSGQIPAYSLGSKPREKTVQTQTQVTAVSLSELDTEKELLDHYKAAKHLYQVIRDDPETPSNQKAAVLNTVTSIVNHIIKMKTDLYNSERNKVMEATLITTLKKFPELSKEFLEEYEAALAEAQ